MNWVSRKWSQPQKFWGTCSWSCSQTITNCSQAWLHYCFWGGPGEFFIRLEIGFLGMQPGLHRFFRGREAVGFSLLSPASEVELSCYSMLKAPWKLKVFPFYMAVKISQSPELPYHQACVCIPHNQDFVHVEQFITMSTPLQSAAVPMKGRMDFFLCGKWEKQCRELAVWPKPREESVLEYSFEGTHPWPSNRGLTTLVPLALLLNSLVRNGACGSLDMVVCLVDIFV